MRILVDSSADYQLEELKERQLGMVPLSIVFGDKSYLDGVELQRNDLYRMMEESSDFPKTSQPSPQDFLDVFETVKENGDEIICILLSSALSGTYQSAMLAKEMADYDKIYLIDSLTATYPIRILADYACKLRGEGMAASEIAEKLERLKSRVKVVAAVDTLEYLCRGGRVNRATAMIGDFARIKPIITVSEEGKVDIKGKGLGINKTIGSILKHLQQIKIDSQFPIYTLYSYGEENCARFEEKLRAEGYDIDARLQIGATIGTHVGPEAFGVVFLEEA